MIRLVFIALALLTLAACNSAPAPSRATAESFTILSEQPDPATGSDIIALRISGPATQASARAAAESVIASRKDRFKSITVKSFLESASATDFPYAVSRLEGGSVSHQFNPQATTQRIPTH